MKEKGSGISIITATYNAATVLPRLIESLRAQTDPDFEWVVVDGVSTDGTLAILSEAGDVVTTFISEHDFGIYDALNKAINKASGDYYLVLGADDMLAPDAIAQYRQAVQTSSEPPDLVTAGIRSGGCVLRPLMGKAWLYGMRGYVSGHSVGVLIRRALHEQYGFYSRRLPIAADQYFVKLVADSGARILVCGFVAGTFGHGGVSTTDVAGAHSEFFRVQLHTGENRFVQTLLYFLRLIKNYRRL